MRIPRIQACCLEFLCPSKMAIRTVLTRARSLYCRLLQPLHFKISENHPIGLYSISPFPSDLSCHGFCYRLSMFQRLSSQVVGLDPSPSADDVNEICRVLSDFRSPHHDIESALSCFSGMISTDLVEQVLKRCKNLGVAAHRFFLWARTLSGFSHSRESYHILIDVLGSSKQFPLIWDFLSELKDGGDPEIRPEIFWIVFRAYCRADLPMDAIRAFNKMDDFGSKPSIDDLDQLFFMLCKRKHVKHAQEFFDSIKSKFLPSPKTYSILMRGWGDIGNSTEARKLFDEMLERGCSLDVVAYNTLLESLCRGGQADEAYKLFREMGLHGLKPDACTYSIFIRTSCETNDIRSALRVLDRMKRYNLMPNVFTYNCIIKLFCKNERVDDAYLLLDEMVERRVSPDIWSYNAIQAFHCDHCEANKALRLLHRMEKDSCMPDRHTYNMLLKMLIRVGRIDRATEVWEGMEEKGFYPSVSTYAVMIHGLCKKKGGLEDACGYFEMMIDEGIPPYPCTCDLLRDCLLQLGLWEKTHILADKMQRSTSCSIQELSNTMKGDKAYARSRSHQGNSNGKIEVMSYEDC